MCGESVNLKFISNFSPGLSLNSSFQRKSCCWNILPHGLDRKGEIGEYELCFAEKSVYWRNGINSEYKTPTWIFTLDSLVKYALTCSFPNFNSKGDKGGNSCLCIVEESRITAFCQDEDIINIALPFPLRNIWSSRFGLILEREPSAKEISSYMNTDTASQSFSSLGSNSDLPILFSLTHPLNEPCHILYKYLERPGQFINYICNPLIQVVHLNEDPSYIIIYDKSLKQHSIWMILPANQVNFPQSTDIDTSIHLGQPMSSSAPPRVQHFEITPFNSPLKLYTPSPATKNKPSINSDTLSTPFISGGTLRKVPCLDIPSVKKRDCLRIVTAKRNLSHQAYIESLSSNVSKGSHSKHLHSTHSMRFDQIQSRYGPGIASGKRAKSLSPNQPFQSPYHKFTLSNPFSPQSDDQTKPVQPELCLHNVFSEPKRECPYMANRAFHYSDYLENEYIVFVKSDIEEIWLLEVDFRSSQSKMLFGNSFYLKAFDAQPVTSSRFLICLNLSENSLHLYSANIHICKLNCDIPKLPVKIRDPIFNRITIEFDDGCFARYSIPNLSENNTILKIMSGLSHILPLDVFQDVIVYSYNYNNIKGNINIQQFLNLIRGFSGIKSSYPPGRTNIPLIAQNIHTRTSFIPAIKCFIDTECPSVSQENINESEVPFLLVDHIDDVFFVLNVILEELMINPFSCNDIFPLAQLLSQFCINCSYLNKHLSKYTRIIPSLHSDNLVLKTGAFLSSSLFDWLSCYILDRKPSPPPFPYIPTVTNKIYQLICIYLFFIRQKFNCISFRADDYLENRSHLPQADRFHRNLNDKFNTLFRKASNNDQLIALMTEDGISKVSLLSIAPSYSFPLFDSLMYCRQNPPLDLPPKSYLLMDRFDIAFHKKCEFSSNLLNNSDNSENRESKNMLELLFPDDSRVVEIQNLFDSTQPIIINIEQTIDMTDEELLELQSSRLYKLSMRTLSLPIGRGMITYGTYDPLPTDNVCFPHINLLGKSSTNGTTITTDSIEKPPHLTSWPEFHNGVAAGLTLNPNSRHVDSSWIQFNQPIQSISNEYAGFLMAMGLQGHLKSLSKFTLLDFLSRGHELTLVGLLIGIAAALRGSMDQDITRMLSIHVRSLQPESSMELEIAPKVQTAAILSVGLLYQGTANRHIVEILLSEIQRASCSEMENIFDRRCRCLSAGFGLGLTLIGHAKLKDSMLLKSITDELTKNIIGEVQKKSRNPSFKSQQISDEGIDILSLGIGSLMALTLIYLKSEDSSLSNFLKPKNSYFLLDETHPFILLLQTVGYCLIQWEGIRPNLEWVNSIIPPFLCEAITRNKEELFADGMELTVLRIVHSQILVGCLYALGIRYAGSHDRQVFDFLFNYLNEFLSDRDFPIIAYDTRINCTLLACSLVMCGIGNSELLRVAYKIRKIPKEDNNFLMGYGNQMAYHMALGFACLGQFQYTIKNTNESIAYILISLFPIFPNTSFKDICHLQAFRHLYALSIERRFIAVKDIHSNELCTANATITYRVTGKEISRNIQLPCLVPQHFQLCSISIESDFYWPFEIRGDSHTFSEIFAEGGLIKLLKKSNKFDYFDPIEFERINEVSESLSILATLSNRDLLCTLEMERIVTIYESPVLESMGRNMDAFRDVNEVILLDKLICFSSYLTSQKQFLVDNTVLSQQFIFLYYLYYMLFSDRQIKKYIMSLDHNFRVNLKRHAFILQERKFQQSMKADHSLRKLFSHKSWYVHLQ